MHELQIIKKLMFAVVAILVTVILILSVTTQNTVLQMNETGEYVVVHDFIHEKKENAASPTGTDDEYHFSLGETDQTDVLMFYVNHYDVEVYFDNIQMYSMSQDSKLFKTTGGVWTVIPIGESDSGKEALIILKPLYEDYEAIPKFMVGDEFAIYKTVLGDAFPELLLSFCNIIAGLFLLGFGMYNGIRRSVSNRLYAIGTLAAATGVWRITYGSLMPLLIENSSVVVYNISLVALMIVALALLNCIEPVEINVSYERKTSLSVWLKCIQTASSSSAVFAISMIYCMIDIVQIMLQVTGVLDLRQTLKLTHGMIVTSALLLCLCSITLWILPSGSNDNVRSHRSYSWILGVGAITDMMLYYFSEASVGMIFTLVAIISISIYEGVKLILSYTEQRNLIKEMEMQLTLSRTTTMMSQIRSHFVFNILNAISGMCKYDAEKADETIVRFSRYLRNNIDIMENDEPVLFSTELARIEDYVILEQLRFGDKIEFYADIHVDDFMIPPLILQPIVENAIKHGITKKQEGGTVVIRTHEDEKNVFVSVEDDGVGFEHTELEKEKSVGLKNIRYRLLHLVGGSLDIKSRNGEGTTVTVIIPKNYTLKRDKKENADESNLCR